MTADVARLSIEESKLFTKVTTLGLATNLPVTMSPVEFAKLIGVVYMDLGKGPDLEQARPGLWTKIRPPSSYYSVPDGWFTEQVPLAPMTHIDLMRLGVQQIPDFVTYLKCLSELHKRRRKYAMILEAQPLPTMVQVSPRSLMEFGQVDNEALAS